MGAPIVIPISQLCDQNGKPLVAATITTYAMGGTVPKATYSDPGLTALNTNPVVTNGRGEVTLYGDGDFRLILKDAAGNLIWDISASSIVSAAMEPVVSAPTIPDAVHLLGIDALIAAETNARVTNDGSLETGINDAIAYGTAQVANEATLRAAADTAETNRAEAVEANLQAQITALAPGGTIMKAGIGAVAFSTVQTTSSVTVPFATPFPTICNAVVVTAVDLTSFILWQGVTWAIGTPTTAHVVVGANIGSVPPTIADSVHFNWIAIGS